jgi:hypothetical protein
VSRIALFLLRWIVFKCAFLLGLKKQLKQHIGRNQVRATAALQYTRALPSA